MREINVSQITDIVERLCIEANQYLPEDVQGAIHKCRACEDWDIAKGVLDKIDGPIYRCERWSFAQGVRQEVYGVVYGRRRSVCRSLCRLVA